MNWLNDWINVDEEMSNRFEDGWIYYEGGKCLK